MGIVQTLSCLTLRLAVGEGGEMLARLLSDRFGDGSLRLVRALQRANERAWKSLEVALAGESFWGRLDHADDRGFRQQLRLFLDALPLPAAAGPEFRQQCLTELRSARRQGLLLGALLPEELQPTGGLLAALEDPQAILQAEQTALLSVAQQIENAGFASLAWLLARPLQTDRSLLIVAVRYFFQRETEDDPQLARSLQLSALEGLSQAQAAGLAGLESALTRHGQRVEEALVGLREEMLGLREEVQRLLQQLRGPADRLPADDPLILRNDRERELVHALLERLRQTGHPGTLLPAVEPPPLPCPEQVILPILKRHPGQRDLHILPEIPPKKLANARHSAAVPADETIFALIDATVFGAARDALLFGQRGLYLHNDWAGKSPGAAQVPYADFPTRRFYRESWAEVGLDRGLFFNRSGSQVTSQLLVELLLAVRRAFTQK